MPIAKPSLHDMAGLAAAAELDVTDADLETYTAAAGGLLDSWDRVEELYADLAPSVPERSWVRPDESHNALGAWYVQSELTEATSGPLTGRRVAVKDNVSVAGLPMMNGSRTVEGYVPSEDATVVRRLLAAGATIAGKSTCEDLCFSGGSHTSKPAAVRNPWERNHAAGGSSSGSAALVASGEVDMALGGDQGGSVRIPAAFCGIVGHKPSFGLVPYTGAFPIEQSIDHLGPMARTVSDVARMLNVIAGVDGLDPRQPDRVETIDYLEALAQSASGLRIGVVAEGFTLANSDSAVNESVRDALSALSASGLIVEDVSIPWHSYGPAIWDVISVEGATWQMVDGNAYGMNWKGYYDPELIAHYGRQWRQDPSQFSETVKLVMMAGRHALQTEYGRHYAMARGLESRLAAAYDSALEQYDVLVMPTLPITATELPSKGAELVDVLGRALEMLGNTAPFDVTGHPACSVPAGLVDGLPVGLMVIGKKFDDATVLRVAHALENTVGGFPSPSSERRTA